MTRGSTLGWLVCQWSETLSQSVSLSGRTRDVNTDLLGFKGVLCWRKISGSCKIFLYQQGTIKSLTLWHSDILTVEHYSIYKDNPQQTNSECGYSTHFISCLSSWILQFHLAPFLSPVMGCHHHPLTRHKFSVQSSPHRRAGAAQQFLNISSEYLPQFLVQWIC